MNRKEILEAADKCVNGHREQDYGSPEDNFSVIAGLWSAYKGIGFTSVDVALMLALLKIARARSGKGTNDCFVDLAGYAACAGEIFGEDKNIKTLKTVAHDEGETDYDIYDRFIKDLSRESETPVRKTAEGIPTLNEFMNDSLEKSRAFGVR